ncbi:MAG: glucose/sorbosone dehydrogenase [Bacteroidetes bacterium]|nr:glucose/sorbosone dehydrogenase [Bacteroidota bacterium]
MRLFLPMLALASVCFTACNNNTSPSAAAKDSITAPAAKGKDGDLSFASPPETDTATTFINKTDSSLALEPHPIHLQKGVDLTLQLPAGYNISIAAEGLNRLRFLQKSPDGRLFATDMHDISDNKKGKVYVFDEWDDSSHAYKKVHTYLSGLSNPNQVAFYHYKGRDLLYVAETGRLGYYEYHAGDTIPRGPYTQIAAFPDYGLSYKYGGWHLTRSLAFHRGRLYVSVGSSCNACIETEPIRASIVAMDPDGQHQAFFATGLRNSVGIKWVGDQLWATCMGRDLIGADKPEDVFIRVDSGRAYHWPYYYELEGKIYPDEKMQDSARAHGITVPPPPPASFCGFRAHSAPLGFDYFDHFSDTLLNHSFLVALHGSTTVSRQRGNAIVKVIGGNRYIDIVSGFLSGKEEKDRKGRPCDVLMNDRKSFFFTDDLNGVLYYVWKD